MHFSSRLSVLLASATACQAAFRPGCEDAPWDSGTDYFLTKYDETGTNLPFAPTYNKTYVYVKNMQRRAVVLHCTNEPPPRSLVDEDALIIKVPVTSVGADDGFSQTIIEMLGKSSTLKRTGAYSDVTSPCIRGNLMNNDTYDDDNWDKAEPVNVTFYGDWNVEDGKRVLVYNNGMYAPLAQLAYLKFFGMFYAMEELADKIYDEIADSYRCAATQVQQAFMDGSVPSGALISPVEKNGDKLTVFQSKWWSSLVTDAGSKLVNVSADGQVENKELGPQLVNVKADSDATTFAKQTWAIIDTSQYDQLPGKQAPQERPTGDNRVNEKSYLKRSGVASDIYAVKKGNVFLVDKAENRNLRHNFFDQGTARPDLVLRDIISIVAPKLVPGYTTSFIRSVKNPDEDTELIRKADTCPAQGKEVEALKMAKCDAPAWASGYRSSGLEPNAYDRSGSVKSLAEGGGDGNGGLTGGQKAGIAVGTICGVLLIAGCAVFVLLRRRSAKKAQLRREMDQVEKGSSGSGSRI